MASQVVGHSSCLEWRSYVHGHHVYCHQWTQTISEVLALRREPDSVCDKNAVTVVKDDQAVGHIPKSISKFVFFFLPKDGHSTFCEVMGSCVN